MKNNKSASIRLPNELWEDIAELAKISDTKPSNVIRIILNDYVKLYKTNKDAKNK